MSAGQSLPALTHRDDALPAHDGEDGVVTLRSSGGGVDEEVDALVQDGCGALLGEHGVEQRGLEDLLEGVEGEAGELALDEVWAVLHDGFELYVAICALPARNQVEHVHAVGRLALLLASGAGELDGEESEQRGAGGLVSHPHQPGVEVDLAGERADGEERGCAHDQ